MKRLFAILLMFSVLDKSIDFDHLLWGHPIDASGWEDDIDSFSELIIEYVMDDDGFTSEADNDQGSPYSGNSFLSMTSQVPMWAWPDQSYFGIFGNQHLIESTPTPLPHPWVGATSKGFKKISSPPPDSALS